jgi:hypothetical protein
MFIEVNHEPRTAIEVSFSAWGGLGKLDRGLGLGETFFHDSDSDRDSDRNSDETFQISRKLGREHVEFFCLLDSQPCRYLSKSFIVCRVSFAPVERGAVSSTTMRPSLETTSLSESFFKKGNLNIGGISLSKGFLPFIIMLQTYKALRMRYDKVVLKRMARLVAVSPVLPFVTHVKILLSLWYCCEWYCYIPVANKFMDIEFGSL